MRKHALVAIALMLMFLSPGASSAGEEAKKVVYFGAITLYHPVVMYQKYQPLMTYLTQSTPYKFELKLNQDYRKIVEYLDRKEVQVALLGGSTYVRAKEKTNLVPILKPLGADGTPFYRCAFIARADNASIRKLSDLRGKSVAFPSVLSTSGFMMPVYCLYTKAGISLNDLKSHQNFRYHDLVAREVLRGSFDAGVVIDHVAGQYEGRGLKTVMISDPIPSLPFVVRADGDPALVNAVKKALLALDYRNPEHRAIMSRWDAELQYGFTEAADRDYDGVREIIRFLEMRRLLAN
jgi:phosphonate transport system substrate-binding protein